MDQENPSQIFKLGQFLFPPRLGDDNCSNLPTVSIFCTTIEIVLLVFLSHLFHMFLKRIGMPSPVSQMLAGIILGPTLLGHINILNTEKFTLTSIASAARIIFMFLVGLEIDILYLKRTFRSAVMLVGGSAVACGVISFVAGPIIYESMKNKGDGVVFCFAHFLILFNTASPVLIRVVDEIKITLTPIGRMSISAALITDVTCLVMLALLGLAGTEKIGSAGMIFAGLLVMLMLAAACFALRYVVTWVNRHNAYRQEVDDDVVFFMLLVLFGLSFLTEGLLYDPMMGAFILGLVVPRDGPTSRTMVGRLTFAVNNFIMPIYFGDAGLHTDLFVLRSPQAVITTLMIIVLGTVGKIGGTVAGAKYLKMNTKDGVSLGLLLNVKGHVDLMVITLGKQYQIWDEKIYMALLITVLFNCMTACPAAAYILHQDRRAIKYTSRVLEGLSLKSEIHILACIHCPQEVPTILDLIEISSNPTERSHLAPYILHLIELTSKTTSTMLYNHLRDMDHENDQNNIQISQVNAAVDSFIRQTSINLRQLRAISRFESMHEELMHGARDIYASLVILPFHRKRRFDGKMGVGKEDIRDFNVNVLRRAPCSIGILVDRGMVREQLDVGNEKLVLRVIVLFLGGPDDREAVSYAMRLASHPLVEVTVARFMPTLKKGARLDVTTSYASTPSNSSTVLEVKGANPDEFFIANFYNRFVVTGIMRYVEKSVEDYPELTTELSSMKGMYSLYIVGRQIQGRATRLIEGMGGWEKCSELGPIGDLLATSDSMLNGSILVIQQHDASFCSIPFMRKTTT